MATETDPDTFPTDFSIPQWCRHRNISLPTYYKLKEQGLGPAEMRFLTLVRITAEADAAWEKARQSPNATEANAVAKTAQAMRKRAKRAAEHAIESEKHVSRRGARE